MDYRYTWLRDSALTLNALCALGFTDEAEAYMAWLKRTTAGRARDLQIMYGVGGERFLPEVELDHLEGYRGSRPVRVGNGAYKQFQLDVFGELLDTVWVYRQHGGEIDDVFWEFLGRVAGAVIDRWSEPDQGIWEIRGDPKHFTYSKVMAWVALDRVVRLAELDGREGAVEEWRRVRDEIRALVERDGVHPDTGAFTQSFGDGGKHDASNLMIPIVGFVTHDDPRARATSERIVAELSADGFVYRYLTAGGDNRVVVDEATRKRRAALDAVGPFATRDPADVRWLLCGRGRPVSAGSSPYTVSVDENRAQVLYQDIEASRVVAEERWEELGYEAIPHPWFEPTPDLATACCLDELRLALGIEELDRYRAAGSDAADAAVEALGALRPELSELGAAGELAGRLAARGFTTPVVLVGGERRAPDHRHPLPTGERLGRFALLAVTAEREGLYVSLTRIVSFGSPPRELERAVRAAAEVDAAVLCASRPGATLGELFDVLARAYEKQGFPEEEDAGRRAFGPLELQRRADQAVLAGLDLAQVEALHRHHPGAEQDVVRFLVADRQVVDADEPDAALDERPRRLAVERDEVLRERVALPQAAVRGLEEHPLGAARHRLRVEPVHDHAGADEHVERQRLDARPAVDEVERRVDVRPAVDAEVEPAEVHDVALRDRAHALEPHLRVAGVRDHPRPNRHAHVDDSHASQCNRATNPLHPVTKASPVATERP